MPAMKFTRRVAQFVKVNARDEKHGANEKAPAGDISLRIRGTKRDLDVLFPQDDGEKLSDLLYEDGKTFRMPFSNPFKVSREPEVHVTIWDGLGKRDKPMEFSKAKISSIIVEFKKGFESEIKIGLNLGEIMDEDYYARLWKLPTLTEREIEIVGTQEELDLRVGAEQQESEEEDDDQGELLEEEEEETEEDDDE